MELPAGFLTYIVFTKYSRFVMWAVKAQARRNIVTKWHALPPITNKWKISWEPKFLCFALKSDQTDWCVTSGDQNEDHHMIHFLQSSVYLCTDIQ